MHAIRTSCVSGSSMRGGLVLGLNASARGAASPSPAKLDIRQSVHKVARQKGVSNGRTYTSKVRRHGFMFLCATYERLCVSLFARARLRTTDANFVSSIAGCIKRSPQVAGRHSSEEMARYDASDDNAIASLSRARARTRTRDFHRRPRTHTTFLCRRSPHHSDVSTTKKKPPKRTTA